MGNSLLNFITVCVHLTLKLSGINGKGYYVLFVSLPSAVEYILLN